MQNGRTTMVNGDLYADTGTRLEKAKAAKGKGKDWEFWTGELEDVRRKMRAYIMSSSSAIVSGDDQWKRAGT